MLEAEKQPFHLIVTDLVMHGVGGVAVARQLRARGERVPILFISGYSNDTPADLRAFGRFLAKPFTPTALIEAVRGAIEEGR
jgi:CheY-like chemotaxis protein